MAYSKQTWVRGEKVASVKLNHMEDGIAAISANGAIDTENLANGAVTDEKLAASGVKSDVADLKSVVVNVFPNIKQENDFIYGRYLSSGFADVTNYARNRKAYPAGKYSIDDFTSAFVVFKYVSDTQGEAIYGSWSSLGRTFTSDAPFYVSFNNVNADVLANINSNFVIKQILNESGDTLSERVDDLDNRFDTIYAETFSKNRYDGSYIQGKFVNQTTGAVENLSTHSCSNLIDISNHGSQNIVFSNTHTNQLGYANLRWAFYKADGTFISGGIAPTLQNNATLNRDYAVITTPQNAVYMRFSIPSAGFTYVSDFQIEYASVTAYTVYVGDRKSLTSDALKENQIIELLGSMTYGKKPSQATADTLTDGQTLVVENNSVMKNQVISLFAKIDGAFSGVFVGHGKQSYGYYIKVDGTNITYCSNGALGTAVPHGLTISEFIGVTVEVDVDLNVKVTIATAGGTFTRTAQINSSWRGDIFAESIGTTFEDAVLTWDSPDYKCPFWAFGDSYFTLYTATRWTYYVAKQWGFDNILLNAYPGENSESGYNDFVNALTHGTPKYMLWCLGMNDPDGASTVNATWLAKAKAVKELCAANEIELIYATIPETTASGTKNTLKNAWIRDSGVRYVDFAAALTDITGWLSDDGVHPSEIGGRFMATYLMASVPEIMQRAH